MTENENINEIDPNIKFIRLNTGEDIVSQIVETQSPEGISYTLINPLKIVYTIGSNPSMLQISMMEWIFNKICDVQEFELNPSEILATANPSESMIDYYWRTINSFAMRKELREKQKENELKEDHIDDIPDDDFDSLESIMEYLKKNDGKRKLH